MARRRRGRVSRSKQNQAGKSTSTSSTGGGGTGTGGGGGGGGNNSGGGGGGGGGNNSGGGGGNQGGGNQGGNNNQGKKDSKITKRNIARFGEKHVRNLQQKQKDFKSVQNKTMSRSAFAAKHYGKGYGTTGNVGRSLARRPETDRELAIVNANRLDSQRLGAEATRLTGMPSNPAFGFSPQGLAQAAENRAKFAEANPMLANVYYGGKDAENRRRLLRDLKEFERRDPTKGGEGWKGFTFSDKIVNKFKDVGNLVAQIGGQGPHTNVKYDSTTGRFMPQVGAGYVNKVRLKEGIPRADAGETDMSNMVASTNLSGLGITPKVSDYDPGSTAFAIATGNYDPAAYESFKQSGLNLSDVGGESTETSRTGRTLGSRALGALDAVTGNLGDFDNMGGQTAFGVQLGNSINAGREAMKNLSDLGVNTGGRVSLKKIQDIAKDINTVGRNVTMQDLAATTGAAKALKENTQVNLQEAFKNPKGATEKQIKGIADTIAGLNPDTTNRIVKTLGNLDQSKVVSDALRNYGGPNLQQNLRDTAGLISDNYNRLGTDTKANRQVMSDLFSGKDARSDFLRGLAFQKINNPNLSTQSQVRYASDPNFKQFTGRDAKGNPIYQNKVKTLTRRDMGLIGGLGNFRLSNLSRDIVSRNLPGTSNALDLASNIINTGRDPRSSTYDSSQAFLRTVGAGGVTPGSLIRGVLPGRRGSNPNSGVPIGQGGGSFGGGTPELPIEELPIIPQTQTVAPDTMQISDPQRLSSLQNQSYQNTLNQLLGFTPNFSASFAPMGGYNFPQARSFRQTFNREYFPQFA